jgi:hypothetical protein
MVALVLVLHAAKLANSQALAGGLQLLIAYVLLFARLQALGSAFMRCGYGPVFRNVFLNFFVAMFICRYRKRSCLRKKDEG